MESNQIEKITEFFQKIPTMIIAFCYFNYIGYLYYIFEYNTDSEKNKVVKSINYYSSDILKSEKKIKELKDFEGRIDEKKNNIKHYYQELQEFKITIPEQFDIAGLINTINTESKKLGIQITKISPTGENKKEFFSESIFSLDVHCSFLQMYAFFERLAHISTIIRIEKVDIKTSGSMRSRYVEVTGNIQIAAYHYLLSKADQLKQESESSKK